MEPGRVEGICQHLSAAVGAHIKYQILKTTEPRNYTVGEALLFWLADWFTRINLLKQEQLIRLLDNFAPSIINFGAELEVALLRGNSARSIKSALKLPMCKLGFLDRRVACMDGRDTFLDLETGESFPAKDRLPLETLAYNLTSLFVRYRTQMNRSCTDEQEQGAS
jgi:hypothetical protein